MPPELIFILVLIVFSVLENAFKAKKKKGGPIQRPPGTTLPPGWPPPGADRPKGGESAEARPSATAGRERGSDMVPEELWEEIAALARGDVEETLRRRRARARAEAEQAGRPGTARAGSRASPPRLPEPELRTEPMSSRREEEPSEDPEMGGVSATPEVGTKVLSGPSRSRAPRSREARPRQGHHAQDLRGGAGAYRSADLAEAREERRAARLQAQAAARGRAPLGEAGTDGEGLRGRKVRTEFLGTRSLRLAIIAREVLGRPLALREYGDEEMWSK